jgi:hypothetical protein
MRKEQNMTEFIIVIIISSEEQAQECVPSQSMSRSLI